MAVTDALNQCGRKGTRERWRARKEQDERQRARPNYIQPRSGEGLLISSSAVCAAQGKGRASRVIVRPDVEVCLPTCIVDVASRLRAMSFKRVVHFGGVEFVVG